MKRWSNQPPFFIYISDKIHGPHGKLKREMKSIIPN
jgi:hypothetical protein